MHRRKNERGVTLVVLVITIIILALISVPIIVNTTEIGELQRYTYFKADIDRLRESIEVVYLNATDIKTIGTLYTGDISFLQVNQNGKKVKNPNDNNEYYIIDLEELNSHLDAQIELKYGKGNKDLQLDTNDIYIINAQSRTIYYVKGIQYKEESYFRLPEDFTQLSNLYVITYDANGGTNAPNMETVAATGSATITIKQAPTKAGYTFKGWKEDGTENIYNPSNVYTVKKNTNFIAQWQ